MAPIPIISAPIHMEFPVGLEPTVRDLQSLAFPLGYGNTMSVNSLLLTFKEPLSTLGR